MWSLLWDFFLTTIYGFIFLLNNVRSYSGENILCVFFVLFLRFRFFFSAETNDFDQQTACGVPVRWLKYTTNGNLAYSATMAG